MNCANCKNLLTEIELSAMQEEAVQDWLCDECFDEDNGYSEHGKYIKLLEFVKKVSRLERVGVNVSTQQHLAVIGAYILLKQIGEDDAE